MGKSSLIDVVSIALGTLFQKIENAKAFDITPDDARGAVIKQGDMFDVQLLFSVTIGADGIVFGENVHWSRSLNAAKGRTPIADAAAVVDASARLQKLVGSGETVVLPTLARYGTDRLWTRTEHKDQSLPNSTRGYEGALQASSNDARMNALFKSQSIWEWQNRRGRHCSLRLKRHWPHVLMPLLLLWTRWLILMPNSASWCLHVALPMVVTIAIGIIQ